MTSKLVSKWSKPEDLGESVPRASTFAEMNSLVFPMVAYLGPYAACDPVLLVKLIRLGKTYMNKVSCDLYVKQFHDRYIEETFFVK